MVGFVLGLRVGRGTTGPTAVATLESAVDFGALTKTGLGGVSIVATSAGTGFTIDSGDASSHWALSDSGVLSPASAGDTADLSGDPYTLGVSWDEGSGSVTVNTAGNNADGVDLAVCYSIVADSSSELDTTCDDLKSATDGGKTILFRPGTHVLPTDNWGLFRNSGADRDYLNLVTVTSHDRNDQVIIENNGAGVTSLIRQPYSTLINYVKFHAVHDGGSGWSQTSAFSLNGSIAGGLGFTIDNCEIYGDRASYTTKQLIEDLSDYSSGIFNHAIDLTETTGGVFTISNCTIHGASKLINLPPTDTAQAAAASTVITKNEFYDFGLDCITCAPQTALEISWNDMHSPYVESVFDSSLPTTDITGHGDVIQLTNANQHSSGILVFGNRALMNRETELPVQLYEDPSEGVTRTGYGQKSSIQGYFIQTGTNTTDWDLTASHVIGNFYAGRTIQGAHSDRGDPSGNVIVANTMVTCRDMNTNPASFVTTQPYIDWEGAGTGDVNNRIRDNVNYVTGPVADATAGVNDIGNNHDIDEQASSGSTDYAVCFDDNSSGGGTGGPFGARTIAELMTVFPPLASGPLDTAVPKMGAIGTGYVDYTNQIIDHPTVNTPTLDPTAFPDLTGAATDTVVTVSTPVEITAVTRYTGGTSTEGVLLYTSGGDSPELQTSSDVGGSSVITAWTTGVILASADDYIWVRDTSSASNSTETTVKVHMGDTTDTWSITTLAVSAQTMPPIVINNFYQINNMIRDYNEIPHFVTTPKIRLMSAAAVAFDPTTITGCVWWLDASDTGSIAEVDVSGQVSTWSDKSAGGLDIAQGTSGLQPATGATTVNSLNVIDFDGVDELLTRTDFVWDLGTCTVFMVVKAVAEVNTYLLVEADTADNDSVYAMIQETATSGVLGGFIRSSTGGIFLDNADFTAGALFDDTVNIGLVTDTGSTFATYVDGGTPDHSVAYTRGASPPVPDNISIGAWSRGTDIAHKAASVCEIIIYDSVISDADKNTVGNAMNAKWGAPWTDI